MAMQHKWEGSQGPEQEEGRRRWAGQRSKISTATRTSDPADIFFSFTHFFFPTTTGRIINWYENSTRCDTLWGKDTPACCTRVTTLNSNASCGHISRSFIWMNTCITADFKSISDGLFLACSHLPPSASFCPTVSLWFSLAHLSLFPALSSSLIPDARSLS